MTPAQRKQHLRELAAELEVSIVFTSSPRPGVGLKSGEADALTATATVFGWTGDNVTYFVGLHELGHFACGHMDKRASVMQTTYWRRIVEAEAEAWAWALDRAMDRVYAETLRLIRDKWLGSYVRDCGLQTAGVAYSSVASRIGLEASA